MANVLGSLFQDIADAIRVKTGTTGTMKPVDFPAAIESIEVGGGGGGGGSESESARVFLFTVSDAAGKKTTSSSQTATATATVYLPNDSKIHSMFGGTQGNGNSNAANALPSYGFYLRDVSGSVTKNVGANMTSYALSNTRSEGNTYKWVQANLVATIEINGMTLNECPDGGFELYADDSVQGALPYGASDYGTTQFDITDIIGVDFSSSKITGLIKSFFNNSSYLQYVKLPETITTIKQYSFQSCANLSSINLENIRTIDGNTFQSCKLLEKVVLSNVTSIGLYVFRYCSNLKEVDCSGCTTVPTLSTGAFDSIHADCQIKVPASLYDEWIAATNWSNLAGKIVAV